MAEKGLVTRDESLRAHVYTARVAEEETQSQLVRDLLDRAFEGSAGTRLVMRALSSRPAWPEELETSVNCWTARRRDEVEQKPEWLRLWRARWPKLA